MMSQPTRPRAGDASGTSRIICEGYGQRVQNRCSNVFSTRSAQQPLVRLAHEIDPEADSIRMYRLRESHGQFLRTLGVLIL